MLPEVEATEEEFRSLLSGKSGRLHIAIECHACFEWLFPVLEAFRKAWPDVDVDIRPGLAFEALPALAREEVDLVVSSDPEEHPDLEFSPLFDYEPVFVASSQHSLAQKSWIDAQDFRDEILITYPVDRARLDVFSQLLMPAKVEPRTVRQVELTAVILLLVPPIAALRSCPIGSCVRCGITLITSPDRSPSRGSRAGSMLQPAEKTQQNPSWRICSNLPAASR